MTITASLKSWTRLLFASSCFLSVATTFNTLDADEFDRRALASGIFVLACKFTPSTSAMA